MFSAQKLVLDPQTAAMLLEIFSLMDEQHFRDLERYAKDLLNPILQYLWDCVSPHVPIRSQLAGRVLRSESDRYLKTLVSSF